MTLFVSYTRSDKALVRALKDDLERMGRSVWLDHQIHGGERWWQEIIQRIQDAEVFLFALSKDSWRSRPCRTELSYAEQLRVPVVPVRVGPLENLRIEIAEKQIIDYRERSADAVIDLIAAITELSAQPRQLPDPLPKPPAMPFEYLYRIAGLIDVQQIPPDDQGQVIAELRRRLKTEDDDLARNDILLLLHELRARNELTVPHAAEIDEILSWIQAKQVSPAEGGATRLPAADHWRRISPGPDPAGRPPTEVSSPSPSSRTGSSGAEAPRKPDRTAARTSGSSASSDASSRTAPSDESGEDAGKEKGPKEESGAPDWLTDLINSRGSAETGASATGAGTAPPTPPRPSDTPPRARKWWLEEQNAPEPPAAPTARIPTPPAPPPTPSAQPPTPQFPSQAPSPSSHRFAFVAIVVVLGIVVLLILAMVG